MDVKDIRVHEKMDARELCISMGSVGFQARKLAQAIELIEKMRDSDSTVFLTFTSNMMASGLRGIFTSMVEDGLVDAVITAGGSIDHDIIRSFKPYRLGTYSEDDVGLHKRGINRIGNILVHNGRYGLLEAKMRVFYKLMQKRSPIFSPSRLNDLIGSRLPPGSFLNACHRREVPVFCPGMVDSACGMHLFFFRQDNDDFILDVAKDMKVLADIVFDAKKTAGIVCGGGISKHHLIGANLLRGGLDMAVYLTTAHEFDGSLSGASAREAKSWGKIRERGETVTVHADASITLPLIASAIAKNKEKG